MWLEDMAEMFEGGLQSEKDVEAEGVVGDTPRNFCIFSLVDPASSHILVSQSSLSQLICACTDHPNAFTLAQVRLRKDTYTHM